MVLPNGYSILLDDVTFYAKLEEFRSGAKKCDKKDGIRAPRVQTPPPSVEQVLCEGDRRSASPKRSHHFPNVSITALKEESSA